MPGCSFPGVLFATSVFITDAWLLDNYFNTRATLPRRADQKHRVSGFGSYNTVPTAAVGARRIDPDVFCGALTPAQCNDAVNNPGGARCNVHDRAVNVFGRDPATGFARRPLDNVGVQHGPRLLIGGTISIDQYLDLDERVGGFDVDANILPPAAGNGTVADPQAMRAVYRSGRMASGGGGLASIPIIDCRACADEIPAGDIHVRYHSSSMRERLMKAHGRADNQVMLHEDLRHGRHSNTRPLLQHAILSMDRWITAIKADARDLPAIEKVVRNRPADLVEGCMTRDATNPVFVPQAQVRDRASSCEALYPSNCFPRAVAGAAVTADVIKCPLRAPQRVDCAVALTDAQWVRLQAAFPLGVCDWSRPGVEQQGLSGTWQRF